MHYRWLVTGGAGFIGSHIVERLLREGHFVRVLDNFSSGKTENLSFIPSFRGVPSEARVAENLSLRGGGEAADEAIFSSNFELIRGDIRDSATCLSACSGVDYVLHQAALRSVPKSMSLPHEYNSVNIDGTVNLLEAALKNKIKRFVMASSSSVYGDAVSFPERESDAPLLISPYALTKLADEYYCRIFSQNYGLETVCLRYFNVFGPKQSLDDEYAVVIPKFIDSMLRNQQPPIHGDGLQSRDFTYIDNVVEANILAATAPVIAKSEACQSTSLRGASRSEKAVIARSDAERSPRGEAAGSEAERRSNLVTSTFCEVFNVALGETHSILGLVQMLNKIMGKAIEPRFTPPRPGDVPKSLADISRISGTIGFTPKVTFEDGLRRTVEWFSKRTEVKAGV
ncbi:UDP-glucose 4-epimerase [sediment metagenome]|uniref:UDP-glucose 4-epimerase n=1 Tax=sediment metagenome TaxID=749907 RepID=D9PIF5_9ZZZZ